MYFPGTYCHNQVTILPSVLIILLNISKVTLMVTNCLQYDGWEKFPISIATTIRVAWTLDADVAAIDCTHGFYKDCWCANHGGAASRSSGRFREMDDLVVNGYHLFCDTMDDVVDSGTRHPKYSGEHSVGCAIHQPQKKNQGVSCSTLFTLSILVQQI